MKQFVDMTDEEKKERTKIIEKRFKEIEEKN
jgi:hypothetical protein